ncbi:MAG TPA: metalloregulator ArsR/SmtB family transcription factor [Solirubrobacteraceae bacterium]|nr:metalloregulator ArsR/SmtB family transcription factor [Solirubrobacteraceae bacterium]
MSNQADLVFDALGEPVRRRIIELLRDGPRPVGHLAGALPVGRPAVSKHLKVLSEAGLTEHQSVGTSNLYSLRPDGVEAARVWLSHSWQTVLSAYAAAAQRESQPARRASAAPKERAQ